MMTLKEVQKALRGTSTKLVGIEPGDGVSPQVLADALEALSMPAAVRRMKCVTTPEGKIVAQTLRLAYQLEKHGRSLLAIARRFAREQDIWKEFRAVAALDGSKEALADIYMSLWL